MDELKINDICKSMTAMTVDIAVIKNEMMHTNTKIDEGIDRLESSIEEIEEYVPEVVWEDKLGYKNIKHHQLTGLFVEAIKEPRKENDELKARISALEKKIKS